MRSSLCNPHTRKLLAILSVVYIITTFNLEESTVSFGKLPRWLLMSCDYLLMSPVLFKHLQRRGISTYLWVLNSQAMALTYTQRSSIRTFCENHNDNDPANKYLRCDLYNIQCLIHCQCFFFNKILMLKKIKDVS